MSDIESVNETSHQGSEKPGSLKQDVKLTCKVKHVDTVVHSQEGKESSLTKHRNFEPLP